MRRESAASGLISTSSSHSVALRLAPPIANLPAPSASGTSAVPRTCTSPIRATESIGRTRPPRATGSLPNFASSNPSRDVARQSNSDTATYATNTARIVHGIQRFIMMTALRVDDAAADRVPHEPRGVVNVELLHQPRAIRLRGLDRE